MIVSERRKLVGVGGFDRLSIYPNKENMCEGCIQMRKHTRHTSPSKHKQARQTSTSKHKKAMSNVRAKKGI